MLHRIQYFHAVVECKSFSDAAKKCQISQSAISQQIQALEKELGVVLLLRKRPNFVLTPAGNYFYENSRKLLSDLKEIQEQTLHLHKN